MWWDVDKLVVGYCVGNCCFVVEQYDAEFVVLISEWHEYKSAGVYLLVFISIPTAQSNYYTKTE